MTIPGGPEWLIILLIVLVLFGSKKLPALSRSVGQSITNFRQGLHEADEAPSQADDDGRADDEGRPTGEGGDADRSEDSRHRGNA